MISFLQEQKEKLDHIENVWIPRKVDHSENVRLCLVTVFVFYFQKLVFGNIKKKRFSCIFEIKNMFG